LRKLGKYSQGSSLSCIFRQRNCQLAGYQIKIGVK
jgi:hypothetical protein